MCVELVGIPLRNLFIQVYFSLFGVFIHRITIWREIDVLKSFGLISFIRQPNCALFETTFNSSFFKIISLLQVYIKWLKAINRFYFRKLQHKFQWKIHLYLWPNTVIYYAVIFIRYPVFILTFLSHRLGLFLIHQKTAIIDHWHFFTE